MADVIPFNAYRPKKGMESIIAALPYDVYNRAESAEIVKKNPESFLAIDRAETQFSDDVDTYDPRVYDKAAEMIQERIADGRFVKDEGDPIYYLYELTMEGRSQTGIVACASIDDYLNGVIKKHENTRADKEQDRINHVDRTGFQTGPIFLAYRKSPGLQNVITIVKKGEPDFDFTSEDGIRHRVFSVKNKDHVDSIKKAFEEMDALYIADGHHRCASAVKVGLKRREENPGYTGKEAFNYFLSVIFPGDELKILDYNRVVKDLGDNSEVEFFNKVIEKFEICDAKKLYSPESKGLFGMYISGKWYKLRAHADIKSDDPVKGLDVSVLQDALLGPVLGIGDPRTDRRIDFVGGIRGLKELERRCAEDCTVAFSMHPTSIEELFDVADKGLLMPPKSTWFEPKLRSGLFLHSIDE